MDTNTVHECLEASVRGTMPFPQIVGRLLEAGVERYTVDFVAMEHRAYGVRGEVDTTPLPSALAGAVAAEFDGTAVQAAIFDSQQRRIAYPEFVARAMSSGVAAYSAFLTGQKVIYWGRRGEFHLEPFPRQP